MARFLEKLMGAPVVKPLLKVVHFFVDGTVLQPCAFQGSMELIDGEDDPSPAPGNAPSSGVTQEVQCPSPEGDQGQSGNDCLEADRSAPLILYEP